MGGSFSWENFPYRSSGGLTQFFTSCDLPFTHDGSTRKDWVEGTLTELNQGTASIPQLPPDAIVRVVKELLDAVDFHRAELDRDLALGDLNQVLLRDGIQAYVDEDGTPHLRSTRSNVSTERSAIEARPLTAAEQARRKAIAAFLDTASEDEFIERLLSPLFRQLGFRRISLTGHRDKSLEFGKDLWMKYQLPTGHFIYFGAQVKKDRIDAAGKALNANISGILAQVRMALDHPIFDPETNRKHLLDHIYIISANVITKQARALLVEYLDQAARRHIIFMDREELLDLGAVVGVHIVDNFAEGAENDDRLPF
jgi:hypothetical protein